MRLLIVLCIFFYISNCNTNYEDFTNDAIEWISYDIVNEGEADSEIEEIRTLTTLYAFISTLGASIIITVVTVLDILHSKKIKNIRTLSGKKLNVKDINCDVLQ
uniref:Uncharacterized protein n=1 Tax=Parastrongyloides trichosuri TaxID=131310 RepID=A0A0N4ZEI3_PARTI